jgi:hypothetical protein
VITINPTETQIITALRTFIQSALPPGVPVIRAQSNRVPEPAQSDWVEMTPLLMPRLATNIDTYADCGVTGSIVNAVLTVTAVQFGAIAVGAPVYGAAVAAGTSVTAFGTGTGGLGTYTVSAPQTVTSGALYAGVKQAVQKQQATVQIDVHGPASADNTSLITTLFRDQFGVDAFLASSIDVAPLYASDPRQLPFINGEDQYEDRWSFDLYMQVNVVVQVAQQFADQLKATATPVESLA